MVSKQADIISGISAGEDGMEMHSLEKNAGTDADMQDMRMLGRTQQLNVRQSSLRVVLNADTTQRNFRFISTLGFACTLMSTWEIELT